MTLPQSSLQTSRQRPRVSAASSRFTFALCGLIAMSGCKMVLNIYEGLPDANAGAGGGGASSATSTSSTGGAGGDVSGAGGQGGAGGNITEPWVKPLGNSLGNSLGGGIAVIGSDVIVSGSYDHITFGDMNFEATKPDQLFVARLDGTMNGEDKWHQILGATVKGITPIDSDADGNIFLAASFIGTDISCFESTTKITSHNSGADYGLMVAKFNGAGTLQWCTSSTGTGPVAVADLVVDSNGQPTLVGEYTGTLSLGTSSLTESTNANAASPQPDGFVIQLDKATAEITWSKSYSGTKRQTISSVTTAGNNVAVSGVFLDQLNGTNFPPDVHRVFVDLLNATDGTSLWTDIAVCQGKANGFKRVQNRDERRPHLRRNGQPRYVAAMRRRRRWRRGRFRWLRQRLRR